MATDNAQCIAVDCDSGAVSMQPQLTPYRIGANIVALSSSKFGRVLCCAATQTSTTLLWQFGSEHGTTIQADGAIQAVAISDDGSLLALGLGCYPLGSDRYNAVVELHSTATPNHVIARRVLPGTSVDRIAFDAERNSLAVATGDVDQHRGHIALLDSGDLSILDVAETPDARCLFLAFSLEGESVLALFRASAQIRNVGQIHRVVHTVDLSFDWREAGYDTARGRLVLSTGEVFDSRLRQVARTLAVEDCNGVAIMEDGRFAFVNDAGVLRILDSGLAGKQSESGGHQ